MNSKILKLTLHMAAFEVMVTGEKKEEYRKKSKWIMSRLWERVKKHSGIKAFIPKEYDFIEFTNGYGNHRPRFVAEYKGFAENLEPFTREYSNGLKVQVDRTDQIISLGKIVKIENYQIKES